MTFAPSLAPPGAANLATGEENRLKNTFDYLKMWRNVALFAPRTPGVRRKSKGIAR